MKFLIIAASAALMATVVAPVSAAELQFTISSGSSVQETFDLDPSAAMPDTFGNYIFFNTTNDSLGNTEAFFGDAFENGSFGTGALNIDGNSRYGTVIPTFSDSELVSPFYSGVGTGLNAQVGESVPTASGDTVTISAVSAAPEPSTWLLMLTGIGGVGMLLRQAKRTAKLLV